MENDKIKSEQAIAHHDLVSPFTFESRNGTKFACDSVDLGSEIRVTNPPYRLAQFAADVAEMVSHHALNIYPDLEYFSGYDTLRFSWPDNK